MVDLSMSTVNRSAVLQMHKVCKSYGYTPILNQLSLQVNQGEIYALLGANGTGKTTTLRIISGLLSADSGNGHCLNLPLGKKPTGLSYMPQSGGLYHDLSIVENLNFFARAHGLTDIATRINATLQAHDLLERAEQHVGTLSGGWRQRVALAVALLSSPKLLLLDEPSAGLDPTARDALWHKLYTLTKAGVSILVTTHYVDEAERCNRVGYLAEGYMIVEGAPQNLAATLGLSVWHVSNIEALSIKDSNLLMQQDANGWRLICTEANQDTLAKLFLHYSQTGHTPQAIPAKLGDALSWLAANTGQLNA